MSRGAGSVSGSPSPARPRKLSRPAGVSAQRGVGGGDAAAGAEHGLRPNEGAGRGVDVPMRVVENEVFERNDFPVEPQTGAAVGKMGPGDPALPDRAGAQSFIEAGERSSAAASEGAKAAQGSGSGSL